MRFENPQLYSAILSRGILKMFQTPRVFIRLVREIPNSVRIHTTRLGKRKSAPHSHPKGIRSEMTEAEYPALERKNDRRGQKVFFSHRFLTTP